MNLREVNTCTNCQSLSTNFNCSKHKKQVDLNSVCDSHTTQKALNINSSCLDCSHYKQSDCNYPNRAGQGMLCFSWQKK